MNEEKTKSKKAELNTLKYYNQFIYRVEKKISVEDHPKIKDYAKKGVYLYVIHDTIDNNRFLFLSSRHYEEETKLSPQTFKFRKITGTNESIQLSTRKSRFGVKFFRLVKEKGNIAIIFNDIITSKTKDNKVFKKYKTHTKKIALDNPDWFLEYILNTQNTSYKKKLKRELLYKNEYHSEIFNHSISSFFILDNPDYMKFNDHNIILDEGKTGKSSLIGYMGEKIDNVSVAGLYGSSDSKRGKFKGGIITTTDKSILIDEVNELIKNNKGEKVLSILNSLLENGTYNYVKQFGQKIRSSNQFYFMGNISPDVRFPDFLLGCFGNVETLGRRIGMLTYNNNLKDYKMGQIRPNEPSVFLNAMSQFMSNLFNQILQNKKFITKLYSHKLYKKLSAKYQSELLILNGEIEDPTTNQFIKSHCSSIDRIIIRGMKMWIYKNIDDFINGEKEYTNKSLFEILTETEIHININIRNFQNIVEHLRDYSMTDKKEQINKESFELLNKNEQSLIKFFYDNKEFIDIKGTEHSELTCLSLIRFIIRDYKNRGIPQKHQAFLTQYGLNICKKDDTFIFRITNKRLFDKKINGLFDVLGVPETKKVEETKSTEYSKKDFEKDNVEMIDLGMD